MTFSTMVTLMSEQCSTRFGLGPTTGYCLSRSILHIYDSGVFGYQKCFTAFHCYDYYELFDKPWLPHLPALGGRFAFFSVFFWIPFQSEEGFMYPKPIHRISYSKS